MAATLSSGLPPIKEPDYGGLFFKCNQTQITNNINIATASSIPTDVVQLITSYVIRHDSFGADEWRKYYGVDIVDSEPPFSSDFYQFLWGPDPLEQSQPVWKTHLPPTIVPERVKDLKTQIVERFHLIMLAKFAENPLVGYRSQLCLRAIPEQKVFSDSKEPIHWILMRKDLYGRNRSYSSISQEIANPKKNPSLINYLKEYSALDVCTVVFTQYVMTGNRYLGTETGIEGRPTFTYVKGHNSGLDFDNFCFFRKQTVIGGFSECLKFDPDLVNKDDPNLNDSSLQLNQREQGVKDLNKDTGFALIIKVFHKPKKSSFNFKNKIPQK